MSKIRHQRDHLSLYPRQIRGQIGLNFQISHLKSDRPRNDSRQKRQFLEASQAKQVTIMEANPDNALMRGQKMEDLRGGRPVLAAQAGHHGLAQLQNRENDLLILKM